MSTNNEEGKQNRRSFIKRTSLLGVALPLAKLNGFAAPVNSEENITETGNVSGKDSKYKIIATDKGFEINAGILSRSINTTGNYIRTTGIRINGMEILSGVSNDFQVTFHRADPNIKPAGLKLTGDDKLIWANGDAYNQSQYNQPVEWKDPIEVNGDRISENFKMVHAAITYPSKGITRLNIRTRSLVDNPLRNVSIDLYYEVYEGYPVIRKWIEITNNGSYWLKIDQLVIDKIDIASNYITSIPLTPEEQGAESSIIAFSNKQLSAGFIAASEIPSAPRKIEKNGSMGYSEEHFEWVLGPSESFISEPVFHFAYSGDVVKTKTGISTPLDRAVEGPFKAFLQTCVGLRGLSAHVPAPIWCSYTNFLVDLTDANMREQADIAAKIGFVTFQLDEGWAKTPSPGGSEPDVARFPDFDATCRYITSKGLQLGLWISCFRGLDSKDIKAIPDGRSLPPFLNTKRGYGMSFTSKWRDYFTNDMIYMYDRYGMTYVKQDLTNISKGDIADGHENRTKKESLLRGLRGLLDANKKMAEAAPQVWTQITHEIYWRTPGPPADIAALKYACAFHTTPNTYLGAGNGSKRVSQDWSYDPIKLRSDLIKSCWQARQRFYDHRGLPVYSVEFYAANAVNIKGSLTTDVQDRQICSWLMGAPTVFAGDLSSLTEENIQHYRKRFDLLKRLQGAYDIYGYFQFSGVPVPTDTDWHWWGKLNNYGYGAVVVIRGSAGEQFQVINIPWASSKKKYQVSALFTGKKLGVLSGDELISGKIKLELPVYGQEILELSPLI